MCTTIIREAAITIIRLGFLETDWATSTVYCPNSPVPHHRLGDEAIRSSASLSLSRLTATLSSSVEAMLRISLLPCEAPLPTDRSNAPLQAQLIFVLSLGLVSGWVPLQPDSQPRHFLVRVGGCRRRSESVAPVVLYGKKSGKHRLVVLRFL